MIIFLLYYTSIIIFILFSELPSTKGSIQGGKTTPKFPSVTKHLESSLAASTAHGTVVAIRATDQDCSDGDSECVVIVSRCPMHSSQSNLTLSSILDHVEMSNSSIKKVGNVTSLSRGPVSTKFHKHNDMMYTLHGSAVIAVTGLASDCKHLIRSAIMDISRYEHVYGSRTTSIPFVKTVIVEGLVNRISSAAFSAGGRPFGVQILTASKNQNRREKNSNNMPSLEIYTIDPSGALRQCNGKVVAIGRFSQIILQNLYNKIKSKKEVMSSSSSPTEELHKIYIQEAIQITIQSIIESEEDEKLRYLTDVSNIASACSEFEIVIVHSSKNGFVSKVDDIRQLYEQSILSTKIKN